MIQKKIAISIEKHLNQYDLFKFDSFEDIEEYANSNYAEPSEQEIELLNNRVMADPSSPFVDNLKFYNGVSSSEVLRTIILSEKFGSYVKCSETIVNTLEKPKKILDIGCSIGYLTTWIARNFDEAIIHGIDNSINSIKHANKMKNKIKIDNVYFQTIDFSYMKFPSKSFDAIIDTQSIYYSNKPSRVFKIIQKLITDDGLFITVPGIGYLEKIKQYLNDIREAGFVIKSIDFIQVENLGDISYYPFVIADLNSQPSELKLEHKFNKIPSILI